MNTKIQIDPQPPSIVQQVLQKLDANHTRRDHIPHHGYNTRESTKSNNLRELELLEIIESNNKNIKLQLKGIIIN